VLVQAGQLHTLHAYAFATPASRCLCLCVAFEGSNVVVF
jgi:hypothetical protein